MRDERQRDREAIEHWAAIEQKIIREARLRQRQQATKVQLMLMLGAVVVLFVILPLLTWLEWG